MSDSDPEVVGDSQPQYFCHFARTASRSVLYPYHWERVTMDSSRSVGHDLVEGWEVGGQRVVPDPIVAAVSNFEGAISTWDDISDFKLVKGKCSTIRRDVCSLRD